MKYFLLLSFSMLLNVGFVAAQNDKVACDDIDLPTLIQLKKLEGDARNAAILQLGFTRLEKSLFAGCITYVKCPQPPSAVHLNYVQYLLTEGTNLDFLTHSNDNYLKVYSGLESSGFKSLDPNDGGRKFESATLLLNFFEVSANGNGVVYRDIRLASK